MEKILFKVHFLTCFFFTTGNQAFQNASFENARSILVFSALSISFGAEKSKKRAGIIKRGPKRLKFG